MTLQATVTLTQRQAHWALMIDFVIKHQWVPMVVMSYVVVGVIIHMSTLEHGSATVNSTGVAM